MFCKSSSIVSLLIGGCALLPGTAQAQTEQAINQVRHINVETLNGKTLGRIREMSIDMSNGRILEVFVLTGGFLGFGGYIVPVPPSVLVKQFGEAEVYQIDMTRAKFKRAPSIPRTVGDTYQNRDRVQASYRYFGKQSDFAESDYAKTSNTTTTQAPSSQVIRSSQLMGMPILNRSGEQIGIVRSLSYYITSGTLENIMMAEAEGSTVSSVLETSAFRLNGARSALILTNSVAALDAAPNLHLIEQDNGNEAYHSVLPSNDQVEINEAAEAKAAAE